ncbi:MAG: cysteine synthase A [Chloroflexota bacterium]|nr:cysteine synthase A [Chloroflexota bacterium]
MELAANVLELIGHTPLVRLNRVTEGRDATVLAKLECLNPSGSMKDRTALYMIEEAERRGALEPGSVVVEFTSGNTGIALAMTCALKGYRMIAVMPEAMSVERRKVIKAYGAEVVLTPCSGPEGGCSREDIQRAREKVQRLAEELDGFLPDQFANPQNVRAHRKTTGQEILAQTGGRLDAFVMGVGTGGTFTGVAQALKAHDPSIQTVAVEPASSAVLSGGPPGCHRIQGIGEGYVPELFDYDLCDEVIAVSDEEAIGMARRLAREEGMFAGFSSGANVVAALQVAAKLGEGRRVVTIIADSGLKYLSEFPDTEGSP